MDNRFHLHQTGWPDIDILECPFQDLYPTIARIAAQARTLSHTDQRKLSTNLFDIDRIATNASGKQHPRAEVGLLKVVQQGASWDKKHTAKAGTTTTTVCDLCGHAECDIVHIIWKCPALEPERTAIIHQLLPGLQIEFLHNAMFYGIAPAMAPFHCLSFWGSNISQANEATQKHLGVGKILPYKRKGRHYEATLTEEDTALISEFNDHANHSLQSNSDHSITAAQIMAHLKDLKVDINKIQLPKPCHGPGPHDRNNTHTHLTCTPAAPAPRCAGEGSLQDHCLCRGDPRALL